jgi:hypothetical protein
MNAIEQFFPPEALPAARAELAGRTKALSLTEFFNERHAAA